ncbi:MAG: PKD domain-containing protein, partial [Flavobacteriales bacterium]
SIQGCGQLLEPPGGVIPPGSQVIFVTSTAMCVQANSFTALNDTLYIIYQNPGNSQGHFKNNNLVGQPITTIPGPPIPRWLRLSVTGTSCGDTATYDANLLVNIYGTYGGLTEENDGATANFSWPGQPVASYVNYGCQAPFTPTEVIILSSPDPIPCGASANLIGTVNGPYAAVHWQGGGGVFSQPDSLETFYTPGGGDNGNVVLSFCAIGACGDTICDQLTVVTAPTPEVAITGDTSLCLNTDVNTLTASGADTYVWSTGENTASIQVGLAQVGTIWVVGTSACGSDSAFTTVSIMTDSLFHQDITCNGVSTGSLTYAVQGGALPYSYVWSTGATSEQITGLGAGTYDVSVTDAEGCTRQASYTLVDPVPFTSSVGADTTICPGGQAILYAQGIGGTPDYTFAWSPEGPVVAPSQTTTYTVVVSDANGCEAAPKQITVTVPSDQAVAVTSTPLDGCATHCITFTASSSTQNTYAWDLGDGATAADSVVEHCYATPGQYTVNLVVVQSSGCPDINSSVGPFTISAAPVADFTWTPSTPTASDALVQFTDLSSGASSWAWQFGDPDGSGSTVASPAFTYPGVGCYPVSLVVTNAAGCAGSAARQLCVSGQDSLIVPNVFSPNNDGQNDVFRITGGGLVSLDVQIFNRWGQEMLRIKQVNQAWDGRSPTGDVVPEGTYFYVLHAVGNSGKTYDLHGTVTLLR